MKSEWMLTAALILAPAAASAEIRFLRHDVDPKSTLSAAAAIDVDGDGRLDVVTGAQWYRAPDWKPSPVREVPFIRGRFDDYGCLPFDVDGDGRVDFLTANYRTAKVSWVRNPGPVGPWTETVIELPGPSETGRLADVDGDGQLDLLPNGRDSAAWWTFERKAGSEIP